MDERAAPASRRDTEAYKKHRNASFMAVFKMMLADRGLIGAEGDKRAGRVHGIRGRPGGRSDCAS